jgi:ABC-type multidrug transport system ATPase subunit
VPQPYQTASLPLSVHALQKRYGRTPVLQDLALEVSAGAIHGLVGLNGSGKTTTLECILGMQAFDAGSIEVMGLSPHHLWQAAGAVVGIFDSPSLHPGLTVRQTLQHASLLCPKPVRSPEAVEELLGIGRYRHYRIRQLSLGNRRRASIAQALIGNPAFVILDEPFNGLDAGGVDDVLRLIVRLNQEFGTAFLLSSHQLAYLERICTHMAILHQGRIAVSGSVESLFGDDGSRLYLRCDRPEDAVALLQQMPGVRLLDGDSPRLVIQLIDNNPSQVNQALVGAGIAVSELLLERPTLDSLFRQLTEDAA